MQLFEIEQKLALEGVQSQLEAAKKRSWLENTAWHSTAGSWSGTEQASWL
jgi:hypothetical protein